MKIFSILLLVTILSSCSVFEEDDITHPIPVDSVFVNNTSNLRADFTTQIYCGSYCWKNTYFEKRISGSDIYIKTFAILNGSSACPDVCVDYQTPISISLISAGSYTFHFWKSDTSNIDTTIIVGI